MNGQPMNGTKVKKWSNFPFTSLFSAFPYISLFVSCITILLDLASENMVIKNMGKEPSPEINQVSVFSVPEWKIACEPHRYYIVILWQKYRTSNAFELQTDPRITISWLSSGCTGSPLLLYGNKNGIKVHKIKYAKYVI